MIQVDLNEEVPLSISFELEPFIRSVIDLKDIQSGNFEFTFVDTATIQAINKSHLGRTYITDIISFNLGTKEVPHGDIYICIEHVKQNAVSYDKPFEEELKLVVVHGILHLLDYRDYTEEEKSIMFAEQDRILALL